MRESKNHKKYHKPSRKISGANLAYICSIGGLVMIMAVLLVVVPNLGNNSFQNISDRTDHSNTSPNGYSTPAADNLISSQTPTLSFPSYSQSTSSGSKESSAYSSSANSSAISSSMGTGGVSSSSYSQQSSEFSASHSQSHAQSTTPQSAEPVIIPEPSVTPATNTDEVVYDKDGIVIVGTRAFSLYSSGTGNCADYANALNKFKASLPGVNVYSLVIPTACEFYSPTKIAARCTSQLANINAINANLINVTPVDAYSELKNHANEPIYLRTDHHWAALGGYYSAKAFAETAGVPFLPLSDYTEVTNTGYVGTMYGYTNKNPILANNPEDFVYHIPKTVDYTTTYYNYKMSGGSISGSYEPMVAGYFLDYGDNASDNYCTFMGGDAKIVHVKTNTKNGRRLAIFKDSFGNTIPGYLFGSFEEIYVMDIRYFSHNAIDYIKQKQITDLLFANNTTVTASSSMISKIEKLITQSDMGF